MARFCSNCGAGLDDNAKFCMSCGTPSAAEAAPPIPEPAPAPAPAPAQLPQPEQQQYMPPQPYPQAPQQPYPQQPYPQQPYPQQAYAPPTPAKKKSRKGLIIGLVLAPIVLIGIVAGIIVGGVFGAMGKAAKADYYELGGDKIPSVKLVLGETRKISGVSSSTQDGVAMKEYTYKEPGRNQSDEMAEYVNYLLDNEGFLMMTDADFNADEAWAKLGRNSADDGFQIVVQVEYDTAGYTITLEKQKGEVKPIEKETEPQTDPEPRTDPDTPADKAIYGMWRGVETDSDGDEFVSLFTFNKNGSVEWVVTYMDTQFGGGKVNGSYTIEDGELTLFDRKSEDGGALSDIEGIECVFAGGKMYLDDTPYIFVESRDRAKVLKDPLQPYPFD